MQRVMSTRAGTIGVGAIAALIAGVAILVFISQYRSSIDSASKPVGVLVAKRLIPKATSGNLIGSQALFQATTVPKKELKNGAISDPSALRGRVATNDIYPGQQLTTADFSATPSDALNYKLSGTQRAVTVPLDSAHGMIGTVATGDHVDVIAGFDVIPLNPDGTPRSGGQARPVVKTIMQNLLVLSAPSGTSSGGVSSSGSQTANVTLQLTDGQADKMAFASDKGRVWLALRGQSGAKQTKPALVTLETLLLGLPPIQVQRGLAGH